MACLFSFSTFHLPFRNLKQLFGLFLDVMRGCFLHLGFYAKAKKKKKKEV